MKTSRGKVNRTAGGDAFVFLIIALFALVMLMPIIYAVSSSLKPLNEFWVFPPQFIVRNPTMKNYRDLFGILTESWIPLTRYVYNALFVSLTGTAGHVIIASMCAYALSKHRFYGSQLLFKIIVFSLMFSTAVTGIPLYLIMSTLKMVDTHWALIFPAFSASLGLFLMKQFMDSMVPDAVIEAAKIDGSGELRTIFSIVMPMVKPAWLTLIVFSFQSLWNNSAGAIFIQTESKKMLNFVIAQIVAGGIARAGAAAAAIVFMMILPTVVFIVTQSSIVETMSSSGIKE